MVQRQRGSGLLIAFMVVLLGIASAATASAAESGEGGNESPLSLIVGISAAENGVYYTDSESVDISVSIRNDAVESVSFEYNPSCPFSLIVTANNGSVLFDIDAVRSCAGQRRAIDIPAGGERNLDDLSWDWQNSGEIIPSGVIQFEVDSGNDVATVSEVVTFHQTVVMPEDLRFKVIMSPLPAAATASLPGDVIWARAILSNTGSAEITVPYDDACKISQSLIELSISELGCGSGESIAAGVSLDLGWLVWDLAEIDLADGEHQLSASPTGAATTWTTTWLHDASSGDDSVSGLRLAASILSGDGPVVTGQDLEVAIDVHNDDSIARVISFTDDCRILTHVINENGEMPYDDAPIRDCSPEFSEIKLQPGDSLRISSETIPTLTPNNCGWSGGEHIAVFRVPSIDRAVSVPFEVFDGESARLCRLDSQSLNSTIFEVVNMRVTDQGGANETVGLDLRIFHQGEESLTLFWTEDCQIAIEMSQVNGDLFSSDEVACDGLTSDTTTLQFGETISFNSIEFPYATNGVGLATGTWLMEARLLARPSLTTFAAHTYNGIDVEIIETEEVPEDETQNQTKIVEESVDPVMMSYLEGEWKHVRTEQGGCWLLQTVDGDERALVSSNAIGWAPATARQGAYLTRDATFIAGDACAAWSPGLHIEEVVDEWQAPAVAAGPSDSSESASSSPPSTFTTVGPPLLIVVATTSLLAMLLVGAINTEWIRLPAMNLGLAVIGMVRKGRDYDGDYQRGRIIGFLVANPGAHFRALLGALSMSNGQLTHHLKVLEGEDKLWRRRDGRLVRFYPASVTQQTDSEELPVPLLTPDPNSLQGKILFLLDQTENEYINLSQRELSERLEASQQLISHHLRTLEKYGLVERQKVGLRYRYELTREAIFLLNSNDWMGQ
jgi:DNA-binding MarR family transcriptional regulator